MRLSFQKDFIVRRLTEPNDQSPSPPQGRRPKVAGGAKNVGQERVNIGRVFLHIKGNDSLASPDQNAVRRAGENQGLCFSQSILAGVCSCHNLAAGILKELLSFLAACSTLAMVHPINLAHAQFSAPTTRQQLCPPNPKLLEIARRTRISRASLGT
jgi:hypothetical protein